MSTVNRFRNSLSSLLLLCGLSLTGMQAAAASDTMAAASEARVSSIRQIASGGREGVASAAERQVFEGLKTEGDRVSAANKAAAGQAKSSANDFWFYTADVVLFGDDDADGYFHGIDLLFDADTIYDSVDVYAVAYLSLNGGPWNEYVTTNVFTIYGASSEDEYVIVTELESGYPTGDYDLLIELYDAFDGAFLAEFGPADTAELSYLALEDYQLDAPYVEEVVVVGHQGGGGAAAGLLGLLLLPVVRQFRRRLASSYVRCE